MGRTAILEQFFCVGLGPICYLSRLDSCLQTYVMRKIKTVRFMLCLSYQRSCLALRSLRGQKPLVLDSHVKTPVQVGLSANMKHVVF